MRKLVLIPAVLAMSCLSAGSLFSVASAAGLPTTSQATAIADAQSSPSRVHDYWSHGCFYVHTCVKWKYGYCKRWGHVQSYCNYQPSGKNYGGSSGGGY